MKFNISLRFFTSIILSIFLLSGCTIGQLNNKDSFNLNKEKEIKQSSELGKEKIKVGFSIASLQDERWLIDRDIFITKCKELGADVIVQSANGNENMQISQCDKMLSQGVDVLVVVAQNSDTASAIVDTANKLKVPVVAYDRLIKNCALDAYITYDNVKIGEMQAEYLLRNVPKGNYILLGGAQTDYCAVLIREGQMKVLQPYIGRGDINIVEKQWTKDWNPYDARKIVEKAISANNNDIQAVVASNDATAGGVIQALAEQKLAGKVAISGQDADLAGCQRIVEGTQSMTVYVPIKAEAEANAEAAIKLAKKEKFVGNSSTDNGKAVVPTLLLTPISVNKDNIVETVIKDGYQKFEEVFKNIPKNRWPPQK